MFNIYIVTTGHLRAPYSRRVAPFCPDLAALPRMPELETLFGARADSPPVVHNFPIIPAEKKCAPYHHLLRAPQAPRVRSEPVRSKKLIKLESLLLAAAMSDDDD
ncbi:hypothetical protein BOTBODRAFT_177471 [Botryobasidium botryosum FD-172 SS1]|uniref:Uncharacterized protein n=1 Tax=Botryobasidium botryosum (strain FD-172 SS1) TaxID=930990 RepID=A0A067M6M2_BOTB1|nr:hypothetical protein BOTBODRAFT_177471 [Botryobasidium botryosum FD-172 SS1]